MPKIPKVPSPPRTRFKLSEKKFHHRESHPSLLEVYSRRIKVLRKILPLIGFFLFSLILAWPLGKHLLEKPFDDMPPAPKKIVSENLLLNPQLVDTDEKDHPFSLAAESSIQQPNNLAKLAKPRGKIKSDQDTELAITAENGNFDQEKGILTYKDNVTLTTSDGYVFKTSEAQLHFKTHIADGHHPITVQGPTGQIEADKGFKLDENQKTLTFFGATKLTLFDDKKSTP